jgi:peptide/nickel transport system permease protein
MTGRFLAARLAHALFTVLVVSVVVFFVVRLTGDPAALMAPPSASQADIDLLRHQLGLDRPLHAQYLSYVGKLLRLDLGESMRFRRPAGELILERLPATAELALASLVLGIVLGGLVGVVAAVRRNTLVDAAGRLLALVGQSVPVYWSGIMLIVVLGVQLRVLPVSGRSGFSSLVMPALTIGLYLAAGIARLVRTSLLEVLSQEYIKTARAKGLSPGAVILGHALRNALLPVVTLLGLQFGVLFGGAVITETVFAWPGLGQLSVQAVFARDFTLVQAIVLLSALFLVVLNLAMDVAYTYIDPRIRYR